MEKRRRLRENVLTASLFCGRMNAGFLLLSYILKNGGRYDTRFFTKRIVYDF